MYLAKWHHSAVAVKVLTYPDNSREAEKFRHGECLIALAQCSKQLNDACYCTQCLMWVTDVPIQKEEFCTGGASVQG